METVISRTYSICCAHQLEGHPKCGRLHGHNYEIIVAVTGRVDPKTGMILDFAEMDNIIKPDLDAMDHRYIISNDNLAKNNPIAQLALQQGMGTYLSIEYSTAECIARYLFDWINSQLEETDVAWVEVKETPKSVARYDRS